MSLELKTDRQTDKQANRQANRDTGRKTVARPDSNGLVVSASDPVQEYIIYTL